MYGHPPVPAKLSPIRARPFTAIPSFDSVGRTSSPDPLDSSRQRRVRTVDMQDHIIAHRTLFTDVLDSFAAVLSGSTAKVKTFDVHGGFGDLGVGRTVVYSGCNASSDSKT